MQAALHYTLRLDIKSGTPSSCAWSRPTPTSNGPRPRCCHALLCRCRSTAFRKYHGPAGRRAALLSTVTVSDGSVCVALPPAPPLPPSPLGAGTDAGPAPATAAPPAAAAAGTLETAWDGDGVEPMEDDVVAGAAGCAEGAGTCQAGAVNIPRRLQHPQPNPRSRRLSMSVQLSPQVSWPLG